MKKQPIINVACYLRNHEGLSLEQLHEKTGISTNILCRIENNKPSAIDKFETLADFYGISVDALVRNDILVAAISRIMPPVATFRGYEQQRQSYERRLRAGLKGEQWLLCEELKKRSGTRFANALCNGYADDGRAGFDILSFDTEGNPIVGEVKSTTGGADAPFYMTAPELAKARETFENGGQYTVYRVVHINTPDKTSHFEISAAELLSDYEFIPKTYEVVKKSKEVTTC